MNNIRRSVLVGTGGFIAAGITANLATYLVFKTGLLNLVLRLVSPDQALVRVLLGVILAFVGFGLGGAIGGLVRGHFIHQVDQSGSRRRYLLGSAVAAGITQGVLVIPAVLFISLLGIYNNGSEKDPASFIVLFGLVGGLFGLIGGLLLSLLTVRLRFAWLPWLANIVGGVIGGLLVGLLVWRPEWYASLGSIQLDLIIFLVLAGVMINAAMGALMGLAYTWVGVQRQQHGVEQVSPARWQDIAAITAGSVVLILLMSFTSQVAEFVTIYPGSLTTSLETLTEGVAWLDPVVIEPAATRGSAPALTSSPAGMRMAWSGQVSGRGEVFYAFQAASGDVSAWSNPVKVSNNPQADAVHPQVSAAPDGSVVLVWEENGAIFSSHCQETACSAPAALSEQITACSQSSQAVRAWPVVAVDPAGQVLAAWSVGPGQVEYGLWNTTAEIANAGLAQSGCLQMDSDLDLQPRLATGASGIWRMATSSAPDGQAQAVNAFEFQDGAWSSPENLGTGSGVDLIAAKDGTYRFAWCGPDRQLYYQAAGESLQTAAGSGCAGRPALVEDSSGQIHIIYTTTTLADNFGEQRNLARLVDLTFGAQGWSQPVLISGFVPPNQPAAAADLQGTLHLAADEAVEAIAQVKYTVQPVYACASETVPPPVLAMLNVIESGEFHPAGYRAPFCGNRYDGMVHMPGPLGKISQLPGEEPTGYDDVAELIKNAREEVLISNMQWDPDSGGYSPGFRLASAVGELYQQIKAHPEAYPRGMTVRILLGNYPNLATLQYGDQIWGVIQDLANVGVDRMEDPAIGWKVEVANYAGSYPHSHTKFLVVDGKTLLGAGFNIAWLHLPGDDPSGKGDDLADLGIVVTGPVAQTGLSVFDDQWDGANLLYCPELVPGEVDQSTCEWRIASVQHSPDVLRFDLPGEDETALAIYRTADYKEADAAYSAALSAARTSIDAMHVNFSTELICILNLFIPGTCTYENTLEYMHSLVDAMENGAMVRVIVENANSSGLENRVAYQILFDELARRGLSDQFELRFFNGRLHMKSALIDQELLVVGSQNFHYSAFGEGGLLEFNVATSSPRAIQAYQGMFAKFWEQAIPYDQAQWGTAGG